MQSGSAFEALPRFIKGANTMIEWIDTNGCPETWHEFKRDAEGKIVCLHADDSSCELTEYKRSDDE